jgi:hypothetical protein
VKFLQSEQHTLSLLLLQQCTVQSNANSDASVVQQPADTDAVSYVDVIADAVAAESVYEQRMVFTEGYLQRATKSSSARGYCGICTGEFAPDAARAQQWTPRTAAAATLLADDEDITTTHASSAAHKQKVVDYNQFMDYCTTSLADTYIKVYICTLMLSYSSVMLTHCWNFASKHLHVSLTMLIMLYTLLRYAYTDFL